jgi:hypothetical protein
VRVRRPLVLALAATSACGTPVSRPAAPPAPGAIVIAHFDPARDLALERGAGDTVRLRGATLVMGRLRAIHGDTAWIAASRVRSLHDDGRGVVPGWTTAVVNDGRTQVVPLSRDTYTDRQGSKEFGWVLVAGVVAAGAALLALIALAAGDPS